jgi:CspA family cold shock protein
MKGKVKFYNKDKHFGFILDDSGKDYFVHESGLTEMIGNDDQVEFDVEEGDKGLRAINVKKA